MAYRQTLQGLNSELASLVSQTSAGADRIEEMFFSDDALQLLDKIMISQELERVAAELYVPNLKLAARYNVAVATKPLTEEQLGRASAIIGAYELQMTNEQIVKQRLCEIEAVIALIRIGL